MVINPSTSPFCIFLYERFYQGSCFRLERDLLLPHCKIGRYFSGPRSFLSFDGRKPEKSETHFFQQQQKNAQKYNSKHDKNNLRKSPEGTRKYVGSDVREGTCSPGKLARNKLIWFWWFLRNKKILKKSSATRRHCHCRFSLDWEQLPSLTSQPVAQQSSDMFGVLLCCYFYAFLFFVFFGKMSLRFDFFLVFSHHTRKSTSDRWSTPLNCHVTCGLACMQA